MAARQGKECEVRLNMPSSQRPHMKGLNRFLTDYCEYWRPIGLKLGLQPSVLGLIEADHRLQQRECFRETLQKWLQQDVHATWRKLELAITNAKREYLGLDALETMPDQCTVRSPDDGRKAEAVVHDTPQYSKHKKCKRTLDDGATAGVKSMDSDGCDEGYTMDANHKRKDSRYRLITNGSPICAVIINNQAFDEATGLCERKGSSEDIKSLQELKCYGLEFHQCPENCKAEEMKAFLTVVASSDDIQTNLPSATKTSEISKALEKFEMNEKIKTAMECLTTEECKGALETVTKNREMKEVVLKVLEKPLSAYHGLIVFIMTHGGEQGKLFGSDGKHITVEEMASLFSGSNCPQLVDKPKIFVIQTFSGNRDVDGATRNGDHSLATTNDTKRVNSTNPSVGVVPIEADFLFVLSTVVNSAGNHHKDGSLFIQSLVNVLGERLNDEHLEDALLKVKDKVASKNISSDDKMCKQMPSVLSQMRDRVWFHK